MVIIKAKVVVDFGEDLVCFFDESHSAIVIVIPIVRYFLVSRVQLFHGGIHFFTIDELGKSFWLKIDLFPFLLETILYCGH